jgi:hypothetical protein
VKFQELATFITPRMGWNKRGKTKSVRVDIL